MMLIKYAVDRIEVQKDEYTPVHDRAPKDWSFEAANDRRAELVHWKRVVVEGKIILDASEHRVTVMISQRGSDAVGYLVTLLVEDSSPLPALDVYVGIERLLHDYMTPKEGNDGRKPFFVKEYIDGGGRLVGVTPSAAWLADVFHHLRDKMQYEKSPITLDTGRALPSVVRKPLAREPKIDL